MRWMLILLISLGGCRSLGVAAAPDGATCPTPPDPVPCIRIGEALAGDADWLAHLVETDATDFAPVIHELRAEIGRWEQCSTDLARAMSDSAPP